MGLDRGALARIDRKLLAGLGKDEVFQMVRVPVAAAKWSTWKRYCDAAGISMGRAIATLIDHELSTVFGDTKIENSSVLAVQAGEELARRQAEVARRERELEAAEERLWAWGQQLRRREEDLVTREQRADPSAVPSVRPE